MDGVVDVRVRDRAGQAGRPGRAQPGGLQTRYEQPEEPLAQIAAAPRETVTELMQRLYQAPIRTTWSRGACTRSKPRAWRPRCRPTPSLAERLGPIAAAAGVDIFVVQSTVTSRRFRSHNGNPTARLQPRSVARWACPWWSATASATRRRLELMETGIAGLLVGVGPGAACTSREVLGIGVPQVTATHGLRRGARRVLRAHRALRADHHRRRHAHRRRRVQGVRQRRRRGHDRLAVRAGATKRRARATTGAWPRRTRGCRAARASRSA